MFFEDGDDQDQIFRAPFIEKIARTKAGNLSLGEIRYFELLLVSHLPHPFLMLDEPFSMVEPLYKEKIKELLITLKAEKGILLTDHYYRDVLDITDRQMIIAEGINYDIQDASDLKKFGYLKP